MTISTYIDCSMRNKSLVEDLYVRSIRPSNFITNQAIRISRDELQLNLYPQVISSHKSLISSLDIDNSCEGRFLLCASHDCTVSVFDISMLGSDHYLYKDYNAHLHSRLTRVEKERKAWEEQHKYHPIARSQHNFTQFTQTQRLDPLFVPSGHSHSVSAAKWYPIDTGIFVSADSFGCILLWDTNSFTPVLSLNSMHVGHLGTCGVASIDFPRRMNSHIQLAVGCTSTGLCEETDNLRMDERNVYLFDIKNGAITQNLVGHSGGVQCVNWSPLHDYILASGSKDGTIKIWDIRKSGSKACLITLDRESKFDMHEIDLGHGGKSNMKMKKRHRVTGPGDYSNVEVSSLVQSHAGPVSALSFTPDGTHVVSASPTDGIKLWNIQEKIYRRLLPTKFLDSAFSGYHAVNPRRSRTPLCVTQPNSFKSATVWVAGRNQNILGFDVHGIGGAPSKVESGHLCDITAIAAQANSMRLFSGSSDGMILGYGHRNEFELNINNGDVLF